MDTPPPQLADRPKRRRRVTVLLVVWIAGAVILWWLLPTSPYLAVHQPWKDESALGFLEDNTTLVTLQQNDTGPLRLWNIVTGDLIASHDVKAGEEFIPSPELNSSFFQGHDDGGWYLRCLDTLTGREVARTLLPERQTFLNGRRTPDGRYVIFAVQGDEAGLIVVEASTGRTIHRFAGYGFGFCISPNGRRLASRGYPSPGRSAGITAWNLETGAVVATLTPTYAGEPIPCHLSPDGNLLLDSHGKVWNLESGHYQFAKECELEAAFFDAEGRWIVGWSIERNGDYTICWYDAKTGEQDVLRRSLLPPGEQPQYRIFSGRGDPVDLLITGGYYQEPSRFRAWLNKLPWLDEHFSAEGRQVGYFGRINSTTGRTLASWTVPANVIDATCDGRWLLTIGYDGPTRRHVYHVPPDHAVAWLVAAIAAWTLAMGVLAWWLRRLALRRAGS